MNRVDTLAYPEPIPPVKGKAAKEFVKRLDAFKLSSRQRALFKGSKKAYQAAAKRKVK